MSRTFPARMSGDVVGYLNILQYRAARWVLFPLSCFPDPAKNGSFTKEHPFGGALSSSFRSGILLLLNRPLPSLLEDFAKNL